jgi:predicted AAA+ superfamily ATPase
MESILLNSQLKIEHISLNFKHYLFDQLNKINQLMAILGARGVGKTTLLLQYAKEYNGNSLYVALDDLFFSDNTLYGLAENFKKIGGELLLLDEVHKYPNWSREIKLISDDFPELQLIFTSSSILDIYKGESDLSRRAINYNLKSLSYREYLQFYKNIALPVYSLEEIVLNHPSFSLELMKKFKPLQYFLSYLKVGAYPYYKDNEAEYYQQILNTINLILDIDLQSITHIDYNNIAKLKQRLYVIATNVPFTPNISKLSERIGVNKNVLVQALQLLEKAELIHALYKESTRISILNKPNKIWLRNTNLNYAISPENVNKGNVRETFFIQHLSLIHHLALPEKGDFLVDNKSIFEIGGKGKTQNKLKIFKIPISLKMT